MRRLVYRILARVFFCQESDLSNVLLHLPIGAIIALIAWRVSGALAISAALMFVFYEIIQRKAVSDRGFPELQGALAGLVIAGLVIGLIEAI